MCGIVGIVGDLAAGGRDRVIAGNDAMHHRGPDDAGVWQAPGVVLGARRLAIIDLSAAGHQPMVTDDGRFAITFNGEVYNHRELRRELEQVVAFRSHTDTEVLLHGYRRWGLEGLLRRAEGMFAFAIWDARNRTLACARDRAGKKPFFYWHRGTSFHFASIPESLLPTLPHTPGVDEEALDAFLVYQAVPAPLSIRSGVRQLPAAHSLVFEADTGDLRVSRYWSLEFQPKLVASEDEVVEQVTALVRDGVRKRLVADVRVGVFLSGGVDSSLVTALAAEEADGPVDAVTMGFDEPPFDERRYARAVAAATGVTLHEEVLRPDVVKDLPAVIWHYGQPVADVSIVPNHYVAQVAARWMKVVLNGDGGDEIFGGYARPLVERLVDPYRRAVSDPVRRAIAAAAGWYAGPGARRLQMLARAGALAASDAFTYDRAFRAFRDAAYGEAFRARIAEFDPDDSYRAAWARTRGDAVDHALGGDFDTYFPDQLLAKADRASMAHSIEARSPLLDTAVMEFAARIPAAMRFRNFETKHVLKKVAAQFVPRQVVYRRKRGFVMPASTWLRRSLAPYARAALDNPVFFDRGWINPGFVRMMLEEHFTGRRDWGEQIFTLLTLEVWARVHVDRTLPRDGTMETFLSRPGRPRMRTLQVGMEWFPEHPGGLNRVYLELARHLPAAGVDVHGLVAGSGAVVRESEGRVEGLHPHRASLPARMRTFRRVGGKAVRGDADRLVVSHFALYARPLLGALGSRPFVVHFQGPWGLEGAAEGHGALTTLVKSAIEGTVYRRADALIVLSDAFGSILRDRFRIPADRIHVVPGGVNAGQFAVGTTQADARRALGWPQDRRIVLAVRRLTRRMGLDQLIAATAAVRQRHPELLVVIAGTGPMAAAFERQVRSSGVQDAVRLTGFVPESALATAYRAADLTIVPSVRLEGFGLTVAESLATGTPCLVTPVGGLPEAVQALSPALVLDGTDAAAIARGLSAWLDGAMRTPSPAECAAFAKANYDWPVIAARVARVYERVVGAARR